MMIQLLWGELVEDKEHYLGLMSQLHFRLHVGLNAKGIWNP